jgi:hypothetical protein
MLWNKRRRTEFEYAFGAKAFFPIRTYNTGKRVLMPDILAEFSKLIAVLYYCLSQRRVKRWQGYYRKGAAEPL